MRSPIFPDISLESSEIEPGLTAWECPQSHGFWIPLASYHAWKERGKLESRPLPDGCAAVLADDSHRRALLCPESGQMLIRYKVGHGLKFHIDLSPVTGGVWLDQGEWEALKSKGLHSQLNLIFTSSYQRQVRNAEYEATLEQTFKTRIGDADFQKVSDFKAWLVTHPKRRDICCYLTSEVETGAES